MFKPIIHNLSKYDHNFKIVQKYNRIIANKNTKGVTLAEKIKSINNWKEQCRKAFNDVLNSIETNN